MNARVLRWALPVALTFLLPLPVFAACSIHKYADLPVRLLGLRALMPVKVNGTDASLVVDSGAFYSVLSPASAAALKLKVGSNKLVFNGVNGEARAGIVTVDNFVLDNIPIRQKLQFMVGGSDIGGADAAGVLGQNVLGVTDTEYDLSDGVIRLMKPTDCGDKVLAYWAAVGQPYGQVAIRSTGRYTQQLTASAAINGKEVRVAFDTGSPVSVMTRAAAERAGIKPDSPGVVRSGLGSGFGVGQFQTWVGPFTSFEIGGEQIKNTQLRFGDFTLGDVDMLLGMDFFLSHRVYVAYSQNRIYFTLNGGPVFNLATLPGPSSAGVADTPTADPASGGDASGPLATAAEYAARGRALLARHDSAQAISDLTQACTLDPSQPDYFYQRAVAYLADRQPKPARPDLDQALKLRPDFIDALLLRARLELSQKDLAGAHADLDAVDRTVASESNVRFSLADLYMADEAPAASVHQLDLWIAVHPRDARLPEALNQRCFDRAMANTELDKAQSDCTAAIHKAPNTASYLDSLGWVYLRLGKLDKSVRQFDLALKKEPNLPYSLYGRGIAELRLGKTAAGHADLDAASAAASSLADRMRAYGISP